MLPLVTHMLPLSSEEIRQLSFVGKLVVAHIRHCDGISPLASVRLHLRAFSIMLTYVRCRLKPCVSSFA